jgi:peptide/nickel transport system substrate-binding protein
VHAHLPRRRRLLAAIGTAGIVGLLAVGCGSSDAPGHAAVRADGVESGLRTGAVPQRGGELVYGLEAETAGGWCLPESQLATSGIEVLRAFYDPLVVPDDDGGYVPYLARSIDHDASYRAWTITLRPDVSFHDGTKLDATVVKNNLDAYRGHYPGRSSILMAQVFQDVASVEVLNELTVRVRTTEPWVAFPAALYGSGRVGIIAQKQLDASPESCASELIGTGPFRFVSWDRGHSISGRRNSGYWQIAPDGEPYPYVDGIEFVPTPSNDERISKLQQGDLNIIHSSNPGDAVGPLARLRDAGEVNLLVSDVRTESAYLILNTSGTGGANPVLARREARRAIANAIDRDQLNRVANDGFPTLASGPFAPGVLGHLDDAGAPTFDLPAAKKAVAALKAGGADLRLRLLTSSATASVRNATMEKAMLEEAGFTVDLKVVAESELIGQVIAGNFDISTFRNQPGDDPDMSGVWWRGGSNPLNFGRFDDAEIDKQLEIGRTSADPDVRRRAYEAVNRRFADQQYNIYLWWAPWTVATAANVHGILGPALPGEGGPAPRRIVTGHPLLGLWIDRS